MHGANRTGRPFTGDYAGILLYESLHALGLSSAPTSMDRNDGLKLHGVRITNAVKCLPPDNKPLPAEIKTCNQYLAAELATLQSVKAVLALGLVAHEAVLIASGLKRSAAEIRPWHRARAARRPHAHRFLPLQPLQHADPPADAGDVQQTVLKRAATLAGLSSRV